MEFGETRPESVGGIMREVLDDRLAPHMTANQRAATAWYRANGDRERRHTMGVFLKASRVRGAAPVLGVYVDSHAMATDFGVNKDLYLARLANIGFEASGIEFLISRKPHRSTDAPREGRSTAPTELPALDEAERQRVEELVCDLPESLRESVSKAVTLSLRREKLQGTKNAEER